MSQPPDNSDSPSHLRISDNVAASPHGDRLNILAVAMGVLAVLIAIAPLFFPTQPDANHIGEYLLSLGAIIGLDLSLIAVALTWRNVFRSRLGEWQFTIEGYQSSRLRNLLLGGGLQLMSLLFVWIPFLPTDNEGGPPLGIFIVLSSLAGMASIPWLIQFALRVKAHDLEVHEEGIMIGGFFPCRWQKIASYQVWEDACTFISMDIRGRGPFETFIAPHDRKLLLKELEQHVGPPTSTGRTDDLPPIDPRRQADPFQIFR